MAPGLAPIVVCAADDYTSARTLPYGARLPAPRSLPSPPTAKRSVQVYRAVRGQAGDGIPDRPIDTAKLRQPRRLVARRTLTKAGESAAPMRISLIPLGPSGASALDDNAVGKAATWLFGCQAGDCGDLLIGEIEIDCGEILFEVSDVSRTRYRQ